jgi:hypothetical protein
MPHVQKFLAYPFDPTRLTRYRPTMLEKMHKYTLLTEPDLGIHIDLIEPEAYEPPEAGAVLLPEDEVLLQEDEKAAKARPSHSAAEKARPNVPWLTKTNYYGNDDLYGMSQGNRVVKDLPIPILEEVKELTPQELVAAIEDSFTFMHGSENQPAGELKHPRNPSLVPVAVWELLPDFQRWPNAYTEIVFDQDPCRDDAELQEGDDEGTLRKRSKLCSNAVIHIHQQGERKNFAYMVPAPGSRKRRRLLDSDGMDDGDADDEREDVENYQCLREYCENEARMYQVCRGALLSRCILVWRFMAKCRSRRLAYACRVCLGSSML